MSRGKAKKRKLLFLAFGFSPPWTFRSYCISRGRAKEKSFAVKLIDFSNSVFLGALDWEAFDLLLWTREKVQKSCGLGVLFLDPLKDEIG